MKVIEKSVEVQVPVHDAFNQWTHFEEFPRFMRGVDEVRKVDETHLHWRAHIGGMEEEWDAEITEMIPNRVIAWRSINGAENSGKVNFEPSSTGGTRLDVRINYEPHTMAEKLGSAMGVVSRRVEEDLHRFKMLMEQGRAIGSSGDTRARTPMPGADIDPGIR